MYILVNISKHLSNTSNQIKSNASHTIYTFLFRHGLERGTRAGKGAHVVGWRGNVSDGWFMIIQTYDFYFERKYFDLCSNRSGQSSIAWVMWCVVERKYRYRRWWGRSHALLSHHQVKWHLRYVSAFRSKRSETHLVRLILAASQQHNRRILFYRFIGYAPVRCPETPGRGTELSTTPTPLNFRNQMEISRCTK